MSIQEQLKNDQAFRQLPLVYATIKAASGNTRYSIEAITLRELDRCSPCLDNMSSDQKSDLENKLITIFENCDWI